MIWITGRGKAAFGNPQILLSALRNPAILGRLSTNFPWNPRPPRVTIFLEFFSRLSLCLLTLLCATASQASAEDGNRLTYLDDFFNPYWVGLDTPRLTTPQWFGEEGVDAVVILSIDDMQKPEAYEEYLRPILDRLKKIDGRAPVSIMTCKVEPHHPQLQAWLEEGLSLEAHTIHHPCPCLQGNDFNTAKANYTDSVDLMAAIPNNRAVAFRMPCCDSMNSVSPRFFAEMFHRRTAAGNFLTIDSSVFNITTPRDPTLPRSLVLDPDGGEKFRKYIPKDRGTYVNSIEDYPYPYVVGRLAWELPSMAPSDWSAQNFQGKNNPRTIRDWSAALAVTVLKQGVFTITFHPHGWIESQQVVRFIDEAVARYGPRVRFLNFREVDQRLTTHLLAGHPLRATNGQDNGVRLLDANKDGYMDVVIANEDLQTTRVWQPGQGQWVETGFPEPVVSVDEDGHRSDAGVRFGVLQPSGYASFLVRKESTSRVYHFSGTSWYEQPRGVRGLPPAKVFSTSRSGQDGGVRLRDLDGDGTCELLFANENHSGAFRWGASTGGWARLPFTFPEGTRIVNSHGHDAGLRFIDFNEDGHDDLVFSDAKRYSAHLFSDLTNGWSREVVSAQRGKTEHDEKPPTVIPEFVRADGSNNGVWTSYRQIQVQNEDTGNDVHRSAVSFTGLLGSADPLPRTPEESIRAIQVRPGFQVELMAAEPLVMDPINMEWGPDGKLWVVEMTDYPMGMDNRGKPGGRVRFLEDIDGDGPYDRSTLFLDEVPFPTSVLPWGKGILVTAAPDLFYAEDTDGDGRADRRETLYRGFGSWNQQHLVNGLRWGLDNWVYLANGDSGGNIESVKTGKTINIAGLDLRVRPDEGLLDAQAGQTQYSRDRDDWGNWFGCMNPTPGWHFALVDHYTRRNPHIPPPNGRVELANDKSVYPVGRVFTHCFIKDNAGFFTSACGITIYGDSLFGPHFRSNTFTSEPIHNAIHRRVLEPDGVTFTSHRAPGEERAEFLASSDPWCRPTTLRTGPDGALWFADMYRAVLEHPKWIEDTDEESLFLRAGHDKGRIYRVRPVDQEPRPIPKLEHLGAEELVAALDTPSRWQRDTAHRMLVRQASTSATPALEKLLRTKDPDLARARLHALCILDGLDSLTPSLIALALRDTNPGIRRHAIRVAEKTLASKPAVSRAVLGLLDDPDLPIQLQLSYSLGEWSDPRAGKALARLGIRHHDDPFLTAAVMSSAIGNLGSMLRAVKLSPEGQARQAVLMRLLPLILASASQDSTVFTDAIDILSKGDKDGRFAPWQYETTSNLVDTMHRSGTSLRKLYKEASGDLSSRLEHLEALFDTARAIATDPEEKIERRATVARLLGSGLKEDARDLVVMASLLDPQTPVDSQLSVVGAMGRLSDDRVPALILGGWSAHTPILRKAILDVLLTRGAWAHALYKAIEAEPRLSTAVDPARRAVFLSRLAEGDRPHAEKLLGGVFKRDRQEVREKFSSVLKTVGNPTKGKAIFESTCSKCHLFNGIGTAVGPDLMALTNKNPDSLLTAILDPNRAVEDKYIQYAAVMADGRVLSGLISNETSSSITLVGVDATEEVLLRKELLRLESSGKSQMPEGLEQTLDEKKLADLIAYLLATQAKE